MSIKARIFNFQLLWVLQALVLILLWVYVDYEYRDCCTSSSSSSWSDPNPLANNIYSGFFLVAPLLRYLLLKYVLRLRLKKWGLWTSLGAVFGAVFGAIVGLAIVAYLIVVPGYLLGDVPPGVIQLTLMYLIFRILLISIQALGIHLLNRRWVFKNIGAAVLVSIAYAIHYTIYNDEWMFPYLPIAMFTICELLIANSYTEIKLNEPLVEKRKVGDM